MKHYKVCGICNAETDEWTYPSAHIEAVFRSRVPIRQICERCKEREHDVVKRERLIFHERVHHGLEREFRFELRGDGV